ncbi:unnamed protein product [Nesidiocoris tenuis]|uniref:Uncharacterized protein n=1 Tax=Nesidiocoris tenuis TaxID=355587 RepID=A0A6H5HM71_9HEMI|nr:unnamed protein product [Nesidiocoris tenuis]
MAIGRYLIIPRRKSVSYRPQYRKYLRSQFCNIQNENSIFLTFARINNRIGTLLGSIDKMRSCDVLLPGSPEVGRTPEIWNCVPSEDDEDTTMSAPYHNGGSSPSIKVVDEKGNFLLTHKKLVPICDLKRGAFWTFTIDCNKNSHASSRWEI